MMGLVCKTREFQLLISSFSVNRWQSKTMTNDCAANGQLPCFQPINAELQAYHTVLLEALPSCVLKYMIFVVFCEFLWCCTRNFTALRG